jgi:hypothetical protein
MKPATTDDARWREDGGVDLVDVRPQWNANAASWTELTRAGYDVYRDLVNTQRS